MKASALFIFMVGLVVGLTGGWEASGWWVLGLAAMAGARYIERECE